MTTKEGYDALMHYVCVEWGFCGCVKHEKPMHVDFIIPPSGPVTADEFVRWVFLADNLNPNLASEGASRQKEGIRAAFLKYMGAEVVDAKRLRWSFAADDNPSDKKYRGQISDTN